MPLRYWLWDWIEENKIDSIASAGKLLTRRRAVDDLRRRAADWEPQLDAPIPGIAIIAGAGADLYSGLQCPNPACQKHAIDRLFRKVWHYFDRIVVVDQITHDIAHHWGATPKLGKDLLNRIEVMLYVRHLGAADLLEFRSKGLRSVDWRAELRKANLLHLSKPGLSVLKQLREEAEVQIRTTGGSTRVIVEHPSYPFNRTMVLAPNQSKRPTVQGIRNWAVKKAWETDQHFLAADVLKAREARVGLGSVYPLHQKVLTSAGEFTGEVNRIRSEVPNTRWDSSIHAAKDSPERTGSLLPFSVAPKAGRVRNPIRPQRG